MLMLVLFLPVYKHSDNRNIVNVAFLETWNTHLDTDLDENGENLK